METETKRKREREREAGPCSDTAPGPALVCAPSRLLNMREKWQRLALFLQKQPLATVKAKSLYDCMQQTSPSTDAWHAQKATDTGGRRRGNDDAFHSHIIRDNLASLPVDFADAIRKQLPASLTQ